MKRSPAIPPRAASLADPETTSQHGGLNDLISDGDTGIGSSRRSPPIASSGRHELQKSDTLEAQRRTLAEGIAAEARVTGITAKLDETGRSFFTKAGFADRIDRPSDIEVTTNWLKPVIQVRTCPLQFTAMALTDHYTCRNESLRESTPSTRPRSDAIYTSTTYSTSPGPLPGGYGEGRILTKLKPKNPTHLRPGSYLAPHTTSVLFHYRW